MIYLEDYMFDILRTVLIAAVPLIIFSVLRHFYNKAQRAREEMRKNMLDFSELMGPEPAEPPQEEPEPPLEPGKVKCEYCDSVVDAGTNCPNCGAVLPRPPKVIMLDGTVRLGPTADDVVVLMDSIKTAPPLTQRR